MKVHPAKNLRLTLHRHHMKRAAFTRSHGTRRARLPVGRAGRLRLVASALRINGQRIECPRFCDGFKPKAWPYDTALPEGLPELPEGPGRPDNVALLLRRKTLPDPPLTAADEMGGRLDVTA